MTFEQIRRSASTWRGGAEDDLRVLPEAGQKVIERLPEALEKRAELGYIIDAAQQLLELVEGGVAGHQHGMDVPDEGNGLVLRVGPGHGLCVKSYPKDPA